MKEMKRSVKNSLTILTLLYNYLLHKHIFSLLINYLSVNRMSL